MYFYINLHQLLLLLALCFYFYFYFYFHFRNTDQVHDPWRKLSCRFVVTIVVAELVVAVLKF